MMMTFFRRTFVRALLVAFSVVGAASVLGSTARGEELQAGIAVVDITPPVPYRMSGYFSERFSTGTRDPLLAKAIVFRQGKESAALVYCDLIGIARPVSDAARKLASKETGIPVSHIAVSATHTHTGPLYAGALRNYFHQKAVAERGSDPAEKVDYPKQVARKIADAIVAANKNVAEVRIASGYGRETRLSFNRRFFMKNTSEVRCNPGQLNPNILRVAGPIDPEVGLIRLDRPGKKQPAAAIVSFALHLDTLGGTLYSADYPGALQAALRKSFGDDFLSLFGTGTCGDINHVDVTVRGRRKTDEIGTMLAEPVASTLPKLTVSKTPKLRVKQTIVNVPLQTYPAEKVSKAAKNMEFIGTNKLSSLDLVEACKITALTQRGGKTMPAEVQVFQLDEDTAIVTLPGEVFVELGMAIKQGSPFKTTLVVELTNDAPHYIPTRKALAEGSYETVNCIIQPGGGEMLVEAAVKLLKELKPGGK